MRFFKKQGFNFRDPKFEYPCELLRKIMQKVFNSCELSFLLIKILKFDIMHEISMPLCCILDALYECDFLFFRIKM